MRTRLRDFGIFGIVKNIRTRLQDFRICRDALLERLWYSGGKCNDGDVAVQRLYDYVIFQINYVQTRLIASLPSKRLYIFVRGFLSEQDF